MKLLLENLPPSLASQRETLTRCLEAMNRAQKAIGDYFFDAVLNEGVFLAEED